MVSSLSVDSSTAVDGALWYDMVDLENRFLNPHEGYRLTLLGLDQSGNSLQHLTVKMTVNGYFQIQKFKYRKHTFFTDIGPKSLDILHLTSETGSGWSAGVETYAERYLESNRSKVTSYDR